MKKRSLFVLLLAFYASLSAQIITRTLDTTAVVGPLGTTNNYSLDIDQDSVIDYTVAYDVVNLGLGVSEQLIKIVPTQSNNLVQVLDSNSGRARLRDDGAVLDSTGIWLNFIPTFTHWAVTYIYMPDSADAYNGDPFSCKYIGLQFIIGADLHYGWLRVEKDVLGARKLSLKEVGYETSPRTGLMTSTNCLAAARAEPVQPQVTASPNPTHGILSLDLGSRALTDKIELYDLQGRQHAVALHVDSGKVEIDLQGLPAGIYCVRIVGRSEVRNVKVIKE